ncbi:MAG: glycosyltransferase family 4 protein [Clostridia bacterium]|nr:glycosyltransferase family 4 protein [Clostridia bacterium]
MKDSILICLNELGIGGVETAVLNQTIQMIKRGHRVIVLAKTGIYTEQFESIGAICINFDYEISNQIDENKVGEIIKIIDNYKIKQIHIHKMDCISVMLPILLLKNIPYVAYVHNGIPKLYDWWERNFKAYQIYFKLYYKNATKIVAITQTAMIENSEKFGIDKGKYLVINNSIDFEKYHIEENKVSGTIKRFLIISRLSSEKSNSIINAIKLFKKYYEYNKDARLTIVGDGNIKETIENEIEDIKDIVSMLGARNDIAKILENNDVVIGLDRSILEAIAMKKIAIISGYDGKMNILTPENIVATSNENFSNIDTSKSIDDIIKTFQNLTKGDISRIVSGNYEFAFEKLNIAKNIFIIEEDKNNINLENLKQNDYVNLLIDFSKIAEEVRLYAENLYNDTSECKVWLEKQIDIRDKQLEEKENQIVIINKQLEDKEKQVAELTSTLENIKSSKIIKTALKLSNVKNKIMDVFKN